MTAIAEQEELTYKQRWIERVKELNKIKYDDLPSIDERNHESSSMIEEYMNHQGRMPEPYWVSRLGTYVLAEILKNNDRDKSTNTEYAILSYRQQRRRNRKQMAVKGEHLDYLHSKFVAKMDSLAKVRNPDNYEE